MANPTRLELATEALYLIGNDSTHLNSMKLWIDRAYDEVQCQRHFRETRATTTFDTVVGTSSYSLPADFRSIYSLRDNTNNRKLVQYSPQRFDLLSQSTSGLPTHYILLGSSLYLWPNPDSIISIQLRYRKILTFATDGTSHALPLQWSDPIILAAAARGLDYLNEHDRAIAVRRSYRYFISILPHTEDDDLIDRDDAVSQLGNAP